METKEKLNQHYGANDPSDFSVKYWFREFLGNRNSTAVKVRSGRPSDGVSLENVKKIIRVVGRPESEGTPARMCHKD